MELTLALTHACDLACDYCFAGAKSARTLSLETGRRAIALALDATRDGRLDVAFLGGEPLLQRDLLLRLADLARDRAQARGVACGLTVTTNGTHLDRPTARALAARGFEVALSLDGTPAAQNRARPLAGGQPSWDRADRALEVALAELPRLSVVSVVDPRTVDALADGVEALIGRGVRRLHLNPNWLGRWSDATRATWRAAYEANAALWEDRHRAGRPFVLSTIDPPIWKRLTEGVAPPRGCGYGRDELAVAPSGRIYPCGRQVGEDPDDPAAPGRARCLGDVATGLDPAARCALPKPGESPPAECQACALRPRCASRCGCANAETTGDPARPGGLLCWHERISIPLADAAATSLYADRIPSFMTRFYGAPAPAAG